MNADRDPMGRAIADYWQTGHAAQLVVTSTLADDDVMPMATLFRDESQMPPIERRALELARGHVLDVGAGAGCHTLALQRRGLMVTAIDVSPLAVATMRDRGVNNVLVQDFFDMEGPKFDTILMMMNGIGIVGTIKRLPLFFATLDRLLAPGGQVLFDSSDVSYLYTDDDGTVHLPDDGGYYGEFRFAMRYKRTMGEAFDWLYIDPTTLGREAARHGYELQVVVSGEHYDYLGRINRKHNASPLRAKK